MLKTLSFAGAREQSVFVEYANIIAWSSTMADEDSILLKA